ncbi:MULTISPECIES: hypothetical protein [unclassified Calothrix]|nr:hypothetical protein [Calothrix sp. FACHB-1219]
MRYWTVALPGHGCRCTTAPSARGEAQKSNRGGGLGIGAGE